MKHVVLDTQDESVRRFFLALSLSPEDSLLELDGKPIAFVSPSPRNGLKGKATNARWTEEKNQRRCDLIDREIDGTLTVAQAMELRDLQREMLEYRRRLAPLPIEAARALHKQLLNEANDSDAQE